jgi:hypothetical protein
MWHEIVRLTDLKLNRSQRSAVGTVHPEEIDLMYQPGSGKLRQALFDWKKVITVWREEHYRTKRLNVTSAVCNEVAEHIQHLRGIKPPGGLTAKPAWYLSKKQKVPKNQIASKHILSNPKTRLLLNRRCQYFLAALGSKISQTWPRSPGLWFCAVAIRLVPLENTKPKIKSITMITSGL